MHVLCRWGEGGPPIELEAFPCSVFPSAGVTNVCEAENLPLIVWDKECMQEMCSLVRGLSSPSSRLSTIDIDIDVIQVIKWTRPFHSVSAYCKTGQWEGLGTRLYIYTLTFQNMSMDEELHNGSGCTFKRV